MVSAASLSRTDYALGIGADNGVRGRGGRWEAGLGWMSGAVCALGTTVRLIGAVRGDELVNNFGGIYLMLTSEQFLCKNQMQLSNENVIFIKTEELTQLTTRPLKHGR